MMLFKKYLLFLFLSVPSSSAVVYGTQYSAADLLEAAGVIVPRTPAPDPSGSPTESPAPSPSPSAAPTDAPTESPAPSPSPSAAPTGRPTGTTRPTSKPTEAPTESPAPSPSPSAAPTNHPSKGPSEAPTQHPTVTPIPTDAPTVTPTDSPSTPPTDQPSEMPSVSMHPSTLPSDAPTDMPTSKPSPAPTGAPTISPQPSSKPSVVPTETPTYTSAIPSAAPTKAPTETPSDAPTSEPSEAPSIAPSTSEPTKAPTHLPSGAPSPTPTEVSFKTKTGITNVMLMDIDSEMGNGPLSQFEIATMQFIRDTKPTTEGYNIQILAVTVLTQDVVYPEREEANASNETRRHLVSEVGLQVAFRTVGVLTQGQPPSDFDLTDITDEGFKNHYGEYLYRLGNIHSFFKPVLASVIAAELERNAEDNDEENDATNKGQFVAAVLFSTLAFMMAIFASWYAVKKHLKSQNRITDKSHMLEYPGHGGQFGTHSLSDIDEAEVEADAEQPQEDTNMKLKPLQLDIYDDRIELEDIGLSPLNGFTPKPPMSPGAMEKGEGNKRRSSGGRRSSFNLSETGQSIKKWLTPRRSVFQGVPNAMEDPPESEVSFQFGPASVKGRESLEPDALKASTTNQTGILSNEKVTISGSSGGSNDKKDKKDKKDRRKTIESNTPLGIPASFFGRNSMDGRSEATSITPMGSTASSFFTKMGKSVFTGRQNMQSDAGMSVVTDSSHKFKFGSTAGKSAVNEPNAYSNKSPPEASDNGSKWGGANKLNAGNLAKLQTSKKETSPNFKSIRSNFEENKPDQTKGATPLKTNNDSRYNGNANEEFELGTPSNKKNRHTYEATEASIEIEPMSKRTRTSDGGSVYSEQSELHLNDFSAGPTTLGARPPKYDEDSFVGHEYGKRPNAIMKPPSSAGARSQTAHNPTSNYTLGARPMPAEAAEEKKPRTSLNTAIKQGDTFDVFAPPGPIGIVVDTSKEGPAVHSLKSTSPMLGLINPGDLIIALDDEDTRIMTAASLTRLMAKKSRQKERKITLLSPDGF
jgi:hypothetical protein